MQLWSIKEVAETLNITPQAIYKNYDKLEKLGYIEKVNGKAKLNIQGYNYLIEKRQSKAETPKENEPGETKTDLLQVEYIESLKNRVNQLEKELAETKETHKKELDQEKERTAYFMRLFEQKEQLLTQYMLPPGEQTQKKSIWSKIFHI